MELKHGFEVPVGIDRAWTHLLDMEQVAACFPGATLSSADGEAYTGSVKVKLGPIQLTYQGSARITEADEAAHRATIEASGKAARSGSTASMTVVAEATELAADRTEVSMTTDLTITGRPAQFGRGVMAEVGDKILGKFADCLAGTLAAGGSTDDSADSAEADSVPSPAGGHGPAGGANSASAVEKSDDNSEVTHRAKSAAHAAESGSASSSGASSKVNAGYTRTPGPAKSPEPIDLLESARDSIVKRLAPVVGGLIVLWLLRALVKRRSRRAD